MQRIVINEREVVFRDQIDFLIEEINSLKREMRILSEKVDRATIKKLEGEVIVKKEKAIPLTKEKKHNPIEDLYTRGEY